MFILYIRKYPIGIYSVKHKKECLITIYRQNIKNLSKIKKKKRSVFNAYIYRNPPIRNTGARYIIKRKAIFSYIRKIPYI